MPEPAPKPPPALSPTPEQRRAIEEAALQFAQAYRRATPAERALLLARLQGKE